MAVAWSRISSKVIAHPPWTDAACKRRCGNWQGHSGAVIPQRGDKRKQEVLGARDAVVTPCGQTRGGMGHVRLDRLRPPQIHMEARNIPWPLPHNTPNTPRNPDSVAAAQRRSALHVVAARHSTLPRLWNRHSMTWVSPNT